MAAGYFAPMWLLPLVASLALGQEAPAPEPTEPPPIHVSMDLQGHPAMHLCWRFFGKGLTDRTPRRSHRHQFRQSVYTPWLDQSGLRLIGMAAMAAEKARNPAQARRMILSQLDYVEAWVAEHSDRYALATSPSEARRLLTETDKTVVFHSIEGGHHLLNSAEDAAFWAREGVALITLIHLRDDELGGSAILDKAVGPLINRAGARARRKGTDRGLTPRGEAAIAELADAGILVDLSHMTGASIDDSLRVTGELGVPAIVTHGALDRVSPSERSFTDAQVRTLYAQGGLFALGLSPEALDPEEGTHADVCRNTIEAWAHHYEAALELVPDGAPVGWSSDWNGWVSHAEPVYGRGRCRPVSELPEPALPLDTEGMVHPGMVPQHFQALERMGVDTGPLDASSERFLRMWEAAIAHRESEQQSP